MSILLFFTPPTFFGSISIHGYLDGRSGQHFKITPPLPSKTTDQSRKEKGKEREREEDLAISIRKARATPLPLSVLSLDFSHHPREGKKKKKAKKSHKPSRDHFAPFRREPIMVRPTYLVAGYLPNSMTAQSNLSRRKRPFFLGIGSSCSSEWLVALSFYTVR